MTSLGEDQLRLCYSESRKHCIQRQRSSGVEYDAARAFGLGKLVADARQDIAAPYGDLFCIVSKPATAFSETKIDLTDRNID